MRFDVVNDRQQRRRRRQPYCVTFNDRGRESFCLLALWTAPFLDEHNWPYDSITNKTVDLAAREHY